MSEKPIKATFVIIGGGIAGVTCAESLAFLIPNEQTILITASPLIKAVTNIVPLGTTLTSFDVKERLGETLTESHPSIKVIHDCVIKINTNEKTLNTQSGKLVMYEKLCVCTGGKPRLICENNDRVIGIRDTESVDNLSKVIAKARRVMVVGNGGIATEFVYKVKGIDITWVIKDKHISATFVDPGAAEFFQTKLFEPDSTRDAEEKSKELTKRIRYTITDGRISSGGPALGPDWHNALNLEGKSKLPRTVKVEYQCQISKILNPEETEEKNWPIYAKLTNGKVVGCDFIISATGVSPNSDLPGLESLEKGEDGGFLVDWKLESSEKDVYAAGDVCTAGWDLALHWFQMRLWTQAHQMGRYAAKSMFSTFKKEEFLQDFCFELFTHVTNFFGYKVVLLGLYNGQKLEKNYEILLRMTKGEEYVKLVMKDGKMQGAVLIGETDLEEMCENLILNKLDLTIYGEDLLNPNIDIEDYFD